MTTSGKAAPSILVVGATGHLGTRLVRRLAAAGVRPHALVRSREKGELLRPLATPVIGDLAAPATLKDAFGRAERVFVVAPPDFPFNWPSVLNDGVLLEAGGSGVMTCIDPDEVAEIAVKTLTEDGHEGKTYRLTSQDALTATDLAALLSKFLGRKVRVFEGHDERIAMAGYFRLVAAGAYKRTDTAAKLLGRTPRAYVDWLRANPPVGF